MNKVLKYIRIIYGYEFIIKFEKIKSCEYILIYTIVLQTQTMRTLLIPSTYPIKAISNHRM